MEDIENITDPVQVRERYVKQWNTTMVDIWKEKIQKLGIVDTGALYNSVISLPVRANGQFTELSIVHEFNMYGIYQDRGTGSNTPIGNGGALLSGGNARKKREWYSLKYYASVCNIRDFLADSIGKEFVGVVKRELDAANGKYIGDYATTK